MALFLQPPPSLSLPNQFIFIQPLAFLINSKFSNVCKLKVDSNLLILSDEGKQMKPSRHCRDGYQCSLLAPFEECWVLKSPILHLPLCLTHWTFKLNPHQLPQVLQCQFIEFSAATETSPF